MSEKQLWFKISRKSIKCLYIYYGTLIIIGLISVIFLLINLNRENKYVELSIFSTALLTAIAMSLLACSMSYIRKLYKSCINLDISLPENNTDSIRQIGVLAYFFLRPVFALALGTLLIITFKAGISSMAKCDELSEKFVYLSVFFAFFVGYSIGDIIDIFEEKGKKIITKIFNNPEL
jgi:hypothetical protein